MSENIFKIYLIERDTDLDDKEIYESYISHIIITNSKMRCRELASNIADFEGKQVWFEKTTKVVLIGYPIKTYNKEKILLSVGNFM